MSKFFPFSGVEVLGAVVVGGLFVVTAYISMTQKEFIETYMQTHNNLGIVVYIGTAIVATVIAPISATPLIPIATALWGPVLAALYTIVGWTVGAVIAFWISRTYGFSVVGKIVKLRKVQEYAEHIPERNMFWTVLLMRIVIPVDALSYAIGLFSNMTLRSYTLATVIGITPFAFIFAYTAKLSVWLQVCVLISTGLVIVYGYKHMRNSFMQDQVQNDTHKNTLE